MRKVQTSVMDPVTMLNRSILTSPGLCLTLTLVCPVLLNWLWITNYHFPEQQHITLPLSLPLPPSSLTCQSPSFCLVAVMKGRLSACEILPDLEKLNDATFRLLTHLIGGSVPEIPQKTFQQHVLAGHSFEAHWMSIGCCILMGDFADSICTMNNR